LKVSPVPFVMVALGVVEYREGDFPGAAEQFSRAISIQPTDVELLLLARSFEQAGRTEEANAARDRAARISPNLEQAQKKADSFLGTAK
jgi:uncharacterized protein HemY